MTCPIDETRWRRWLGLPRPNPTSAAAATRWVTQPLRNLAKIDVHEGQPKAAIERLRRACAIFETRYGPSDRRIASAARELAEAMLLAEDPEGLAWAKRAYTIHHDSDPDPVQSAEYAFTLARSTQRFGDASEAVRLAEEAKALAATHGTHEDVSLEEIEAWLAAHGPSAPR